MSKSIVANVNEGGGYMHSKLAASIDHVAYVVLALKINRM